MPLFDQAVIWTKQDSTSSFNSDNVDSIADLIVDVFQMCTSENFDVDVEVEASRCLWAFNNEVWFQKSVSILNYTF